ncbi:unnamed protein product [Prorocentrum cordatum]|uniref:Protein-serine/threonine kinase n=1 Tax=Prorocentrum cordatum TaxID=2364126 RepID=A0ABN9UWS5_9DINO|nr:unnamed protein product [Polarella glacialis]
MSRATGASGSPGPCGDGPCSEPSWDSEVTARSVTTRFWDTQRQPRFYFHLFPFHFVLSFQQHVLVAAAPRLAGRAALGREAPLPATATATSQHRPSASLDGPPCDDEDPGCKVSGKRLQQFLQAEVTHFAAMKRSKLTLEDLLRAATSPHRCAMKVHEEIPKHFAARLRQIESLDGWREDPDLSAMWDIYFQSFEEIRMADVEEDLEPFTAVVRKLKERQRKALPLLGKAVHRRSRMQTAFSASTNEWMERFLTSRIGTEMLTSQYIAIINQVSQGKDQLTGIVDPHVSPEQVCKAAAEAAKQLCLSHMGMAPDIEIDVRVKRSRAGEISFSYIWRLEHCIDINFQSSARMFWIGAGPP